MHRWSLGLAAALLVGTGAGAVVATSAASGRGPATSSALSRRCAHEAHLTAGVDFPAWHLGAVQFSSPSTGLGLTSTSILCYRKVKNGYTTSGHAQVAQLATTSDGGRFWQLTGVPLPGPGSDRTGTEQLAATSPAAVWALLDNGRLVMTTDQGAHWTRQPLPGTVSEIEVGAGSVWALTCVAVHRLVCHPELWHTHSTGTGWRRLRVPQLTVVDAPAPQLAVLPGALLLGVVEPNAVNGHFELLHTGDLGARWSRRPVGSGSAPCIDGLFATAPPATASLLCSSEGAAGSDDKSLWRSTDGGDRWRVASTAMLTGRGRGRGLPPPDAAAFAAGSPGRAWLASYNALVTSSDGGVRWTGVAGVDPEGAFSAFDVLSPTDSWLLGPNSGLWHTADGVHWRRVGPQNG